MSVDAALFHTPAAALSGLFLSVVIERLLKPRPLLRRPPAAWGAHVGLWCAGYCFALLVTGRPWCAVAAVSAVLVTLTLVSNAKMRSLREPFIFQDYDYFLDTFRYPRLFLPFLGLKNFLQAAVVFLSAIAGLYYESPPMHRFALNGQFGGILAMLCAAALLLLCASRRNLPVRFNPEHDLRALGLLACIWAYGRAESTPPDMRSPFDAGGIWVRKPCPLPHLAAIQHESFFDARTLYSGIRPDVLAAFDDMRSESAEYGTLAVPAWGANTLRTEFAFLTGVNENGLGVHRFNPYREVVRGRQVSSLPMYLKRLGYRTVCIHPYWARYYARDRVFAQFGFDEFLDIRAFAGARCSGPYVADAEVGEKIVHVLREATCPTFVFAVTMESHGPLHLERTLKFDADEIYVTPPPSGCDELTIYLHHLRNTDNMLRALRSAFIALDVPVGLCSFGDHVPIMPKVYDILGTPDGAVPYLLWNSRRQQWDIHSNYSTQNAVNACDRQSRRFAVKASLPARLLAPAWLKAIQDAHE
jgi:hypothetical protein